MEKVQCKECEEMGHYARDCPNKKCRNCEKPGHHSRECPVLSPNPPQIAPPWFYILFYFRIGWLVIEIMSEMALILGTS